MGPEDAAVLTRGSRAHTADPGATHGSSTAHRRALPITGYPKEDGCRRAGRLQSSSDRPRWCSTTSPISAPNRHANQRCCLGRAGGSPRFELELQLGPPLLVGLLGQAKIGLSGADLLDGALERVETQGIDAALIQPHSGHASRESLSGSKVHRWLGLGRGRGIPGSGGDLDAAGGPVGRCSASAATSRG